MVVSVMSTWEKGHFSAKGLKYELSVNLLLLLDPLNQPFRTGFVKHRFSVLPAA